MSIDDKAFNLIGQIVQHNADQAAHLSNWLIEAAKEDTVLLARALVRLFDAIDESPVIDRKLLITQGSIITEVIIARGILEQEDG